MADEPVIAPDQLKPGPRRAARIGGIVTIVILLAMIAGNERGRLEDYVLVATAALLALIMIGDVLLRRSGIIR